jgi:hypothetical protein
MVSPGDEAQTAGSQRLDEGLETIRHECALSIRTNCLLWGLCRSRSPIEFVPPWRANVPPKTARGTRHLGMRKSLFSVTLTPAKIVPSLC